MNYTHEEAVSAMWRMIQAYEWPGDEKNMLEMYAEDRLDFMRIINALISKDYELAMDLGLRMDTAAREYIPDATWDFLEEATA